MGMFDSVMVPCPACGKLMDFQSKAWDCDMLTFQLENAPPEILMDIMNEPKFHQACGQWVALVDPAFPPPYLPRPNLRVAKVRAPDKPNENSNDKWWPYDLDFTFDDLEEPL